MVDDGRLAELNSDVSPHRELADVPNGVGDTGVVDDGIIGVLRDRIESLEEEVQRRETDIEDLQLRWRVAQRRIELLEAEPEQPKGSVEAPLWVRGRLRRALVRTRVTFALIADVDTQLERFQQALDMTQDVVDDLAAYREARTSWQDWATLSAGAEDCLQELLDAAVSVEQMREIAKAAADAEDEIELALGLSKSGALVLGHRARQHSL